MARIDAFLQLGREQGCSDIHFTVGLPPLVRQDGELTPLKYRALTVEEMTTLITEILPPEKRAELDRRGAVDLSYLAEDIGRFRINIYKQRLGISAICRVVPDKVPKLEELGLPQVLTQFCALNSGLVLVTGGVGSGKSTTLAAMIDEINDARNLNIITLEDPIEFRHESRNCLVMQRELGTHVRSFQEGLRASLREDPDVILVGEMRDPETIALAIEASETGHLVLGTLHTRGAYQTIHRIVDSFPVDSQSQIRHTLSENLKAVISQDLIRVADGRGRRVAVEIMVITPAISQLIREGKTHQLMSSMSTGRKVGMQLMDQALLSLVQAGEIDPDEAFLRATDKRDFIPFVTQSELLNMADGPSGGAAGAGV